VPHADSLPVSLPLLPDFSREAAALARGASCVAGVDEAGRGPLAGPVVAAAVVFPDGRYPDGLDDSKRLSPEAREALFALICSMGRVAVAVAPPVVIDRLNIRGATLWAMRECVIGLCTTPGHALIDGRDIPPGLPCPAEFVIGGDGLSVSVAAASIIAKVTRDRMCAALHIDHPGYGFPRHKGYGTAVHLGALTELGPCRHHRTSFAPVALAGTRA